MGKNQVEKKIVSSEINSRKEYEENGITIVEIEFKYTIEIDGEKEERLGNIKVEIDKNGSAKIEGKPELIPNCFLEDNQLVREITIPDSVSVIGYKAFKDCSKLNKVEFQGNIEDIQNQAFLNCNNLSDLIFPMTLKRIGDKAFCDCTSIISIDLESCIQLEKIGNGAFMICTKLETVKLPVGINTIPSKCFKYCGSLKEISMKSGSSIVLSKEAFLRCMALETITLPKEGQCKFTVGPKALRDCPLNLKQYEVEEIKGPITYKNTNGKKFGEKLIVTVKPSEVPKPLIGRVPSKLSKDELLNIINSKIYPKEVIAAAQALKGLINVRIEDIGNKEEV